MNSSLLLPLAIGCQGWASYGKYPPPVAPYSDADLPAVSADIELVFPLLAPGRYRDDYNSQRSGFKHTGIDIKSPKLTPIVAPFSGILGFKVHSFWIYRKDGWKCLGTHLNDDSPGTNDGTDDFDFMFAANLKFGDYVTAGQLIGYVGDSGDATAPHLHFEIYSPEGICNPFSALGKAKRVTKAVPSDSYFFAAPIAGEERFDVAMRGWKGESSTLSGILVSKQFSTGDAIAITEPKRVNLKIPGDISAKCKFERWPQNRPVGVYFRREKGEMVVTKVIEPI
jgi:hypothetical protein